MIRTVFMDSCWRRKLCSCSLYSIRCSTSSSLSSPLFSSTAIPFLESLVFFLAILLVFDEFAFCETLHAMAINIISTYFARKFAVADLCALYLNKRINEQWKVIINSLKNGKVIMSDESPLSVLFYNPCAEKIAADICRIRNQQLSIQELLASSVVKIIYNGADNEADVQRKGFIEFIEDYKEESYTNCDCFLDVAELLIEVKMNRVIFDNNEAKLVSLTDCTAARSLERMKTECKYKTILISSISHELRTPVNAILGTLELVKDSIPKDSVKLLEMSKECCNMITSHINDLTVACAFTSRITESFMRRSFR
eukprot:TRINITY_DN8007_c0_g1_i14.p1 TRINITY_DN8007_c0_g1~~TRINITY_DN8007_c0_g1_i14.p1  ORF type:complete len:312 (-),score=53.89 TRINITY_DN8007_c0_g1_i14:1258-2193(-)